jgi:hypothetical protein
MIHSLAAALRGPDGRINWPLVAAEFLVCFCIVAVWPWLVALAMVAAGVGR